MSKGSYSTKQGTLILSCFENSDGAHLTIEAISDILNKNSTPVSTATISRHVQKLVDEGKVRKFSADNSDSACFQYIADGNCTEHFHLKCTKCDRLIHATCTFLDGINTHIYEHHGFLVDNSRTVFYGICDRCLRVSKKH